MRPFWKMAIVFGLCTAGLCTAFAQTDIQDTDDSSATLQNVADKHSSKSEPSLTPDDRLSLLAAALDARVRRETEPDCSHLVHAIYEAAGFSYVYAPSGDLYAGVEGFERVKSPQPGDLVVWRGHVGMVVKPSEHIFFSFLSSGPGTDDYESAYWKHRGRARFYRYVKTDSCVECEAAERTSHRLLDVKR